MPKYYKHAWKYAYLYLRIIKIEMEKLRIILLRIKY